MSGTRYVMTLDLKADPAGIAAYRKHHREIWPEVRQSLLRVGVRRLDIYQLGQRLVMILDAKPGFDIERDFAAHAASHPRCAEWEELMKSLQQAPPGARPGKLWTEMEPIFHLEGPVRSPAGAAAARRPRARRR